MGGRGSSNPAGGKTYGGEYGKISQKSLDELISFGASRWQKNGLDRLYFGDSGNNVIGLEVDKYKTGNISSAYLDGQKISNSLARDIQGMYKNAYIDLTTGGIRGLKDHPYMDKFLEGMKKYRKKR